MPAWNIVDSNCQLCHAEAGTLEHRLKCTATTPVEGWPDLPQEALRLFSRLSQQRKRILGTTGLLVLRLPAPPQQGDGSFQWMMEPDDRDPNLLEAVWYFDGSLFDGKWKPFRVTGFGLVVATTDVHLLGYGRGCPPSWCRTAAAAEAWALRVVPSICPFTPAMRTDCLSLLRTAEEGPASATAPSKQLARIWCLIAGMLDGDFDCLCGSRQFVWMPAHQTLSSVGERKLSSGMRLSFVDWRANRLVDALAKMAAAEWRTSEAVRKLLDSAAAAVKHSAMLLGRVTHEANNHEIAVTGDDGVITKMRVRDATEAPRSYKRKVQAVNRTSAPVVASPAAPVARGPLAALPCKKRGGPVTSQAVRARFAEIAQARRRVEDVGASLSAPVGAASARDRLESLGRRVRARFHSEE